MPKRTTWAIYVTLLALAVGLIPTGQVDAQPRGQDSTVTPAEVIEAVNALRLANGLPALSVHPVLMEVAQWEANAIAGGAPGHTRPAGLTLGEWLLSLGYPLAGDLSLDGIRSENWVAAGTASQAIEAWLGDAPHTNTMLSPERSDIGAGVAVGDQTIIVIETALQTGSGGMQSEANDILTAIAGGASLEDEDQFISQYILPIRRSTAHPNGDVYHRVMYGHSLWSIATNYHTTIAQICAWNNLHESDPLYEGQMLLVARGATQPPPASSTPEASPTVFTVTPRATSPFPTTPAPTDRTEPAPEGTPGAPAIGTWAWVIALLAVAGSAIGTWLTSRPKVE
jgi:uncharacterized protein YkwD